MIDFLKHKNLYLSFSALMFIGSIIAISTFGLNLGIDFSHGSILGVQFKNTVPNINEIRNAVQDFGIKEPSVRVMEGNGVEITFQDIVSPEQTKDLSSDQIEELKTAKQEELKNFLNQKFGIIEQSVSFEEVSPIVGSRMLSKTAWALILSVIVIITIVAISFRKISRPISSWKYGIAAIVALFHDITLPIGLFAILGKFYGVQFTLQIIIALLTVFGYSVNDTIVIFDRIRENLIRKNTATFYEAVNKSLNEVIGRSLATSFATLLPLFALYFLGGETLKYFSLALLVGLVLGAYSSIFIATPIVYLWARNKIEKIK